MKFIFLLLLVAVLAFVGFLVFHAIPGVGMQKEIISIRGKQFTVDVALTPIEQARGLSGHAPLAADEGMLFPFPPGSTPGFWMKDMLFPIDIIWISNSRVVGLVENVQPDDRLGRAIYYPPQPIDEVLEVTAGTVERQSIQAGDEVIQ